MAWRGVAWRGVWPASGLAWRGVAFGLAWPAAWRGSQYYRRPQRVSAANRVCRRRRSSQRDDQERKCTWLVYANNEMGMVVSSSTLSLYGKQKPCTESRFFNLYITLPRRECMKSKNKQITVTIPEEKKFRKIKKKKVQSRCINKIELSPFSPRTPHQLHTPTKNCPEKLPNSASRESQPSSSLHDAIAASAWPQAAS